MSKYKNRYIGTEKGILDTKKDELIPEDEPIFVVRGCDEKAPGAIVHYKGLCRSEEKRAVISKLIHDIAKFQDNIETKG